MKPFSFLLTCEHARNHVPGPYRSLFEGAQQTLESHRGWDPGASLLATEIAKKSGASLFQGEVSRLLVELNRTEDHPQIFSEFTKSLDDEEREELLNRYHRPHWKRVRNEIQHRLKVGGLVIHLGIHSFVPVFEGVPRSTQIGILDDPSRDRERQLARQWQRELRRRTDFKVHLNRPYRGTGNGLVSQLRQEFPKHKYFGFEIEMRQDLLVPLGSRRNLGKLLSEVILKMQ